MFFPLKDENPTVRTPYLTIGIIVICVLVFLWQAGSGTSGMQQIIMQYGLIPASFFGSVNVAIDQVSPVVTLFTSMFLHGGWMHLIGNVLFLWIFGNNIEDDLGYGRFIIFYLVCGLAAAFTQMLIAPHSEIPMVGASGAISGVMGAYIILYPHARILTLVFLGFFITTMRIAAGWFLGIWFGMQALYALASSPGDGGGVAFWAHVGGFVAGVILIFMMRPTRRPQVHMPHRRQRQRFDDDDNVTRGPWG